LKRVEVCTLLTKKVGGAPPGQPGPPAGAIVHLVPSCRPHIPPLFSCGTQL
jgi:hypothetical protein